jgi:hypothetical protein
MFLRTRVVRTGFITSERNELRGELKECQEHAGGALVAKDSSRLHELLNSWRVPCQTAKLTRLAATSLTLVSTACGSGWVLPSTYITRPIQRLCEKAASGFQPGRLSESSRWS